MALYQRLITLSAGFSVELVTTRDAVVPGSLIGRLRVVRLPAPKTGHSFWGRMWAVSSFAIMATVHALMRCAVDSVVVYTFHGSESMVGITVAVWDGRWVADILDLPDEQFEVAASHARRDGYVMKWLALSAFVKVMRRGLRLAEAVVTVAADANNGLAPTLQRQYGVERRRLMCIPNGVDLEHTAIQHLSRSDADRHIFRIFYVGAIAEETGIECILGAMRILRGKMRNCHAQLAGPVYRPFSSRLLHLVDEWQLHGYVSLPGRMGHGEVLRQIELSDVCIYPFLDLPGMGEAMPIKVFEYLALGKAIVASNVAGMRAIIRHGRNGLLAEPGSPPAWADAIERLSRDCYLKATLERNARPSIAHFDWRTINAQYLLRLQATLN